MTERLFLGIINTSAAGGISILIFCFLSWIFRGKYGARSRKNGWLLIAVCLLLPLDLVELPYIHTRTVQLPSLAIGKTMEGAPHMQDSDGVQQFEQKNDTDRVESVQSEPYGATVSTEKILFCIWLTGALLLAAYQFYLYWKLCRRVQRWGRDCQNERLHKMATDIAADLGLKSVPKLRIIQSDSPFTMGITKNIICLPNEELLEKDFYYILKHELIHCREWDILWKLLLLTVNIIHWFNPLVWLLRRLAENDMEQVCDEGVLQNATKEERREYSEVIMVWVEKSGQHNSPVATGYMTEVSFLKWRFSNIYDSTSKKNGTVLFGAMCVAIMIIGGAVDIRASQTTGETFSRTNRIPISVSVDSGIEARTDLNGDGKEDRVRTIDVRSGDAAFTQIIANVNGTDVAIKDFDGYYASTVVTGDLSGNGKADVVSVRAVTGSNYGAVEVSILHLEGTEWVEYPYNFIHNPDISIEQPTSFEAEESWLNGDLYIEGATIFEEKGKTMVRFIQLLPEEGDDTVNVIDASYRKDGWYIENIQTVSGFYSGDRARYILEPGYQDFDFAVRNTAAGETKAYILLEDFWETGDFENTNVLQFATGLEIVLPKEWIGKVVLDTDIGPEHDPYGNTLMICEKTNAENQCGVLFYLDLTEYDKGYVSYTINTV